MNPLDRLHLGILASKWKFTGSAEKILEGYDLRAVTGIEVLLKIASSAGTPSFDIIRKALEVCGAATDDFDLTPALDYLQEHAANLGDDARALVIADCEEWRRHWDTYVRSEPGGRHAINLGQVL